MDQLTAIWFNMFGGEVMKKLMVVITLTVIALFGVSVVNADIVVLDFESLSTPGTGVTYIGRSYTEDGFNLEGWPADLLCFNLDSVRFAGSTALFAAVAGKTPTNADTMLTHADGLAFDLLSINLSEIILSASGTMATFIGTRSDNSTITDSLALDGVFGFETFSPQGFTDLISLRLTYDYSLPSDKYQYDNITLDIIPEPVTLLLLAFGVTLFKRR
jgi:hypothetical protein